MTCMEKFEDVKYTNSSLHSFIQQYKHIKYFNYQGSQIIILTSANTKSVKCEQGIKKEDFCFRDKELSFKNFNSP